MNWNPTEVRNQVKVTPAELVQIRSNMKGQPQTEGGKYPADAVFEGGGVWGTAFLGAVRCCEDIGITWVGLAGTSAGAITAGLLAAGYTAQELEHEFAVLNYNDFVSERTYRFGWDSDPSNDLEEAGEVLALLGTLLARGQLGRYKTDLFYKWYDSLLAARGATTFRSVFRKLGSVTDTAGQERDLIRQLRVVATDLTRGRLRVLPDTFPDADARPLNPNSTALSAGQADLSVAHAVRCSVSIPGFFEPARLPDNTSEGDVIIDGGVLSNFPLWLFDDAPGRTPGWPTFGFRLTQGPSQRREISSITDVLKALFRTMMSASDLYYVQKAGGNRVMDIDLSKLLEERPRLTATAFNLSGEDQAQLYRVGYLAAKHFFLNVWNWNAHVQARTVTDSAVAAAAVTHS